MPQSPNTSANVDQNNDESGDHEERNMSKLAGFHNLIPIYDGESSVTVNYFINTFEKLADALQANPTEKLLIIKSKIRGLALSQLVNSVDLASETDYEVFKNKFIKFFGEETTLAGRQLVFSGCKMINSETIKQFGARVVNASISFLGTVDMSNVEIQKILDNAKLSKFLEGVLNKYKKHLMDKNFQTYEEAFNFLKIVEINEKLINEEAVSNISQSGPNLEALIATQSNQTHQSIAALTREVGELRLNAREVENSRNIPYYTQRNERGGRSTCRHCGRNNHDTANCFFRNGESRANNIPRRNWSAQRSGYSTISAYDRNGFQTRDDRNGATHQQWRAGRPVTNDEQPIGRRVRFQSPEPNRHFRVQSSVPSTSYDGAFVGRNSYQNTRGIFGNRGFANNRQYTNDYQQRNYNNSNNRDEFRRDDRNLNSRGAIMKR